MILMKIDGLVNGGDSPFDGKYLAEYDPDRRGIAPDGRALLAHIVATDDPAKAMRFADAGELLETWRRVSAKWPVRHPDGEPNRPLTAFTVLSVPTVPK